MPVSITYRARIISELTKLFEKLEEASPDARSNTGRMVARAFVWDEIQTYAKKQSDVAWDTLGKEEIATTAGLNPGTHVIAETKHFTVTDRVSEPRKGFKEEVLMKSLKQKYKIPELTSKEMIENAKVPGKSTHTLTIIEK